MLELLVIESFYAKREIFHYKEKNSISLHNQSNYDSFENSRNYDTMTSPGFRIKRILNRLFDYIKCK